MPLLRAVGPAESRYSYGRWIGKTLLRIQVQSSKFPEDKTLCEACAYSSCCGRGWKPTRRRSRRASAGRVVLTRALAALPPPQGSAVAPACSAKSGSARLTADTAPWDHVAASLGAAPCPLEVCGGCASAGRRALAGGPAELPDPRRPPAPRGPGLNDWVGQPSQRESVAGYHNTLIAPPTRCFDWLWFSSAVFFLLGLVWL